MFGRAARRDSSAWTAASVWAGRSARAWLAERSLDYPVAIVDQRAAVDFGVWAFPTLVVIDPAGRIRRLHQGVLSRPELEAILDEIASEGPTEAAGAEAA